MLKKTLIRITSLIVAVFLFVPGPARSETLNISFSSGWNLVSFTFYPANPEVGTFFGQDAPSAIYMFDDGTYTLLDETSSLERGKGYWMYFEEDCELSVEGNPTAGLSTDVQVTEGWNLMGYPYSQGSSVSSLSLDSEPLETDVKFFYYDSATNNYYESSILIPHKAFWMKSEKASTLEIPNPTQTAIRISDDGLALIFAEESFDEGYLPLDPVKIDLNASPASDLDTCLQSDPYIDPIDETAYDFGLSTSPSDPSLPEPYTIAFDISSVAGDLSADDIANLKCASCDPGSGEWDLMDAEYSEVLHLGGKQGVSCDVSSVVPTMVVVDNSVTEIDAPVFCGDSRCSPTFPPAFEASSTAESIDIYWETPDTGNITGFNVYRCKNTPGTCNEKIATVENSACPNHSGAVCFKDTGMPIGAAYYYNLTAIDASGNESAPSETLLTTILLNTPILRIPYYDKVVYEPQPEFIWEGVNGATMYTIQVLKIPDSFSNPISLIWNYSIEDTTADGGIHSVFYNEDGSAGAVLKNPSDPSYIGTQYQWRVCASNDFDFSPVCTNPSQFYKNQQVLESPVWCGGDVCAGVQDSAYTVGASGDSVTFYWKMPESADIVSFMLVRYNNDNGLVPDASNMEKAECAGKPGVVCFEDTGLDSTQTYSYYLYARDIDGDTSDTPDALVLSTNPTAPNPTSPAYDETVFDPQPEFKWTGTAGAQEYKFEIVMSPNDFENPADIIWSYVLSDPIGQGDPQSVVFNSDGLASQQLQNPADPQDTGTAYKWRVCARSINFAADICSPAFRFLKNQRIIEAPVWCTASNCGQQRSMSYDIDVDGGTVSLYWEKPADPDVASFNIYRCAANTGTCETKIATAGNSQCGDMANVVCYNDTALEMAGVFYYTIVAANSDGNTSGQSETLVVAAELGTVLARYPAYDQRIFMPDPEFVWEGVAGAAKYTFQLAERTGDFSDPEAILWSISISDSTKSGDIQSVTFNSDGSATKFMRNPADPNIPGIQYKWQVCAYDETETISQCSITQQFYKSMGVPYAQSPRSGDRVSGSQIQFSWTEVYSSAGYSLVICKLEGSYTRCGEYASPVLHEIDIPGGETTSYSFENSLDTCDIEADPYCVDGRYLWQIRAYDKYGNFSSSWDNSDIELIYVVQE